MFRLTKGHESPPEIVPYTPSIDELQRRDWEATHLYDRYMTDTLILSHVADIRSLYDDSVEPVQIEGDEENRQAAMERRALAEEAAGLLAVRYLEIHDPPKRYAHLYSVESLGNYPHAIKEMAGSVQTEWKKHYLEPRTEWIGVEAYDDWAETHVAQAIDQLGPEKVNLVDTSILDRPHFYRALYPVDLVPDVSEGYFGVNIIAPPDVSVVDESRDNVVFRWDEVADVREDEVIKVYPSTRQRLIDSGIVSAEPTLLDVELALRRKT